MKKLKKKEKWIYTKTNMKLIYLIIFKIKDIIKEIKEGKVFKEFGVTMFTGKQGAGKSIAMTEYLLRMKVKYPNVRIITNYGFSQQDKPLEDWTDFQTQRNGTDGVIFAIDEIQNEFSNDKWKTFPEWLLKEITQQRKQRIKIVTTSQVFTRVVKQIREQAYDVAECRTLFGRWTFVRIFDGEEYNDYIDSPDPEKKRKLVRKQRYSFIQTDELRKVFESYDVIETLKDLKVDPKKYIA